jgi:hypothetical protein
MHSKKPSSFKSKHKYASGGCAGKGCPGPHYDSGGFIDSVLGNDEAGAQERYDNSLGGPASSSSQQSSQPEYIPSSKQKPDPHVENDHLAPPPSAGRDLDKEKSDNWANEYKGGRVEDHLDAKEKMLLKARFADGGEVKGVHNGKAGGAIERRAESLEEDPTEESMKSHVYNRKKLGEAKDEHRRVLGEMKAMPKPKLQGLAEGGEVEGEMDIKDNMSDPDVMDKGDNDYDSEIHDLLGKELMEAFHSKDHKRMAEGLEAMILQCLDDKEGE